VHHPNDHPHRLLHWLANHHSSRGETLLPDVIITTGSFAGIVEVPMNILLL
jgi:2-keto-4-pentenoate hydratase